jgi:hypothetical protein
VTRVRAAWLGVLASLPAVLATVAALVFAARELTGTTPLSLGPMRNVAEAAGGGQVSEVLRFLRAGEDPARFWPVRPEIISDTVTRPTGLEAALWGGQGLVELLDRGGYIRRADTRAHLACLAKDTGRDEIAALLMPDGAPACEPGAALASVRRRSALR